MTLLFIHSTSLSLFTCSASIFISIFAVVGNTIIIVTVIKDPLKCLHTPFNYVLLNLALSDFIVGLLTMPLSAYGHYQHSTGHLYPTEWTTFSHMSYFVFATGSFLNVIVLSLDRMIAIKYPIYYRVQVDACKCIICYVGTWIVSILLSFLYFKLHYCGYLLLAINLAIFVGLVTIIMIYTKLLQILRSQAKRMLEIMSSSNTESTRVYEFRQVIIQKKVTRTFLVVLIALVAVQIPAAIMIYIACFCRSCNPAFRSVLRDLQFLLISSTSCVNLFIYPLRIKKLKLSVRSFCCRSNATGNVVSSPRGNNIRIYIVDQNGAEIKHTNVAAMDTKL